MFRFLSLRRRGTHEEYKVTLVCPHRTLGLEIDGQEPPFRVNPLELPSTETEIEEGDILVGLDEWRFLPDTRLSEVLNEIRRVMSCDDQPVIKLVLQRAKDKPVGSTWKCQRCTMVNTKNQYFCKTCGLEQWESMRRLKASMQIDWRCTLCRYKNPSDKDKCVMCETARSRMGQQNEYVSAPDLGSKDIDEQLKVVRERLVVNQKPQHPIANPKENKDQANARASRADDTRQIQQGSRIQCRQPMMGVNRQPIQPFENQPPRMQSYGQHPQPQPKHPEQQPYIGEFLQHVQKPNIARGWIERKMAPLQTLKPVVMEPKPEREAVKSAKRLHSWKCGLCTTNNNADAATCSTCGVPRMSGWAKVKEKLHLQAAFMSGKQQARKWKCTFCLYENRASDVNCKMCSRSPHIESYEVISDPKYALETVDRKKIAMEWLQKQLIAETGCCVADFDAAFSRADYRVSEAVFRLTSGFHNLDMFKGRLERFIDGQVGSLKQMWEQLEGRQQKVIDKLEKVGTRYQKITESLNITQLEIDEKSYLKVYQAKLDDLFKQEEDFKHRLEEIKIKKDNLTLKMRSEQINKKLELKNSDTVLKQLKEYLGFLRTEKNELDVQGEIIRQQVNNYNEMRRSLENVKLNDLKWTAKTVQPFSEHQSYSQNDKDTSSPINFKRVSRVVAESNHQHTPQLQSQESTEQSTLEKRKELSKHQEELLEFSDKENTQKLISKDPGDTLDENSDDVLFCK